MVHSLSLRSDVLEITLPQDVDVRKVVVNGVEYNLQRTCNQLATDCISRQAAVDDLHGKDPSRIWDTADIEVWINELPSAEPKKVFVTEVIRCKDCKHWR